MATSTSARKHLAAWWLAALLLALLCASACAAQSAATTPTLATLILGDDRPYINCPPTPIGSEKVEFRKEPAYQGKDIRRGVIKVTPSPESWIPYAWDVSEGQVYLDLNSDGDLTNDPSGTKEALYAPEYDYHSAWIVLKNKATASLTCQIGVSRAKAATWNGGGPFRYNLRAGRRYGCLYLEYEPVGGAGQNDWSVWNSPPPGFAIFKGGRKIVSGPFQRRSSDGYCAYAWRIPLRTFGTLQIAAGPDAAALTPADAQTVYTLGLWNKLPDFVPFLVLVALLLACPSNRRLGAWAIFVPVGVLHVLTRWAESAGYLGRVEDGQFAVCTIGMLFAVAAALLTAPPHVAVSGWHRLLRAAITMGLTGTLTSFTMQMPSFQGQTDCDVMISPLLMTAVGTATFLCGITLIPVLTRCRDGLWSYGLLSLLTFPLSGAILVLCLLFGLCVFGASPGALLWVFFFSIIYEILLLLVCYVILLVFLLLVMRNRFYRTRVDALLGLSVPT